MLTGGDWRRFDLRLRGFFGSADFDLGRPEITVVNIELADRFRGIREIHATDGYTSNQGQADLALVVYAYIEILGATHSVQIVHPDEKQISGFDQVGRLCLCR